MMTITNLTDLLMKHLQGSLSDTEQEQLDQWLLQSDRNRRLFTSINDEEQLRQMVLAYHQEQEEDDEAIILSKIRRQIGRAHVRRIHTLRRWGTVAAIALLFAGIGGYFLLKNKTVSTPAAVAEKPADIPPGKEGAVLTLADGRQVVLDSLGNGVIATQNGTQLLLQNGALSYAKQTGSTAPVYNTLTTPKGRQFQVILPDGTKVWLNAASSLRYPTVFSGSEREVSVTGEAYFEVAHDKAKPFIVNLPLSIPTGREAGGSRIQVLGTQFNVNAYANEAAIKTTLIEGSLKIVNGQSVPQGGINRESAILKPGEQAVLVAHSPLTIDHSPDIDKAVAWKSGFFNFEDARLEEVMRQLERWYDIEVVYEKNIPDIQFGGKMSNDVSLSGLLKSLKEMEVHFRIEGRKLIVLP
jgi:ferric-dicitrate binding protein FerR (iron transport regulator)